MSERRHNRFDDVSHGFVQKLWKHANGSNLWSRQKRSDNVVAWRDKAKQKRDRRWSKKTDGWISKKQKETDLLQSYAYTSLPSFPKITFLEWIDYNFFDFHFHFNLAVLIKEKSKTFHVTLNEGSVTKSFLSVKVPLFDIPRFSAFFRWYFSSFRITNVWSEDLFL